MVPSRVDPDNNEEIVAAPPTALSNPLGVFPLSLMQESLWFMDQVAPGSTAYNLPEARRLRGPLNILALRQGLDALVRRHESLRTLFRTGPAGPRQVLLAPRPFPLLLRDLTGEPPSEGELAHLLNSEAARPFDLGRGPLACGTLFRLGSEDHLLLINLHHIICDQWSVNLFFSELAEAYTAIKKGDSPSDLELPVQYADFAVWQRQRLTGKTLQQHLDYWREKLKSPLPGLALSTDFPRPPRPSFRGKTLFASWPDDMVARLRELSRTQGATLFMTLLAGFKVLLHRYSRHTDIVVGSPMMRREPQETQALMGFFVNTHGLRTDLSGNPSFTELLARVRETVLGADAHQELSVDQVVRELRLQPDPRSGSLFQVVCGLQPAPRVDASWKDLDVQRIELDNGGAKFDWSLLFTETNEGLQLRCEYRTDLFEKATITRRLRHFETLIERILCEPARRISEFGLLTEPERAHLLAQPRRAVPSTDPRCLHERFAERAAAAPDSTAVLFEQKRLSYRELNKRANQLAHYLRRSQVGPETPVALCLDRGVEMVIAILAVLKAGGVYVPMDPGYPAERLRFMLEDTGARVVLTDSQFRSGLPATAAQVICLDSEWPKVLEEAPENPRPIALPHNAAYIIYTSGSTGKPKGVVVTHENLARLFTQTQPWFGFNANDVWCLFHSYTFDFSVWELWGALLYGGKLVVVPYLVTRSPGEFYQLLAAQKVTVLNQTPSAFGQLMAAEARACQPLALSLRYVIFGGEALSLQSLRPWFELHGSEKPRLINMYGITETTVHVTYREIGETDLAHGSASLIGLPIPDLRLYLLDEHLQPVPVGVPGEIFVGGAGVARGYLNRPELTGQRFLADPFAQEPGAKLYRSGDLARYTSQGELEYLGRIDSQVKIRGFRIELGEVEAALNRHDAVRQSVVLAREAAQGGQSLVAYIVPANGVRSAAELRRDLDRSLPEHMIPSAFVFLDSLPLTINGKVDRGALPPPTAQALASSTDFVAPRNPTEQRIADIWCELLGRSGIGVHDNFFQLGGHSLLATQVMARLGATWGCELSVRMLFEAPTIAELAQALGEVSPQQPPVSGAIPRRTGTAHARELLERLDQLSPAEIDELLHQSEAQPLST